MSVSRFFRQVASGDSVRYKDEEFDLNLTYITPTLVAMGFPASGVEGMFRNSIVEVAQFLIEKHKEHFMIFNLSERTYDYSLFNNQVLDFGFPDHHNPPLLLLFTIINSIHSWLSADTLNIAVIHCLAGKGRTGTIIASYLLYAGLIKDPSKALEFYACRRSHVSKGVTRPSQKRYVQYFHKVCFCGNTYKGIPKRLVKIEFGPSDFLGDLSPIIIIDQMNSDCIIPDINDTLPAKVTVTELYHSSLENALVYIDNTKQQISYNLDISLSGDIVLRCKYISRLWRWEKDLFRISFHTAFIPENNILVLPKQEIGLADKDTRFIDDFAIYLYFEDCEHAKIEDSYSKWNNETCSKFFSIANELRNTAIENKSFLNYTSDSE